MQLLIAHRCEFCPPLSAVSATFVLCHSAFMLVQSSAVNFVSSNACEMWQNYQLSSSWFFFASCDVPLRLPWQNGYRFPAANVCRLMFSCHRCTSWAFDWTVSHVYILLHFSFAACRPGLWCINIKTLQRRKVLFVILLLSTVDKGIFGHISWDNRHCLGLELATFIHCATAYGEFIC